jgi:energy-coupling factor transporter ATP-binding protein EcfA2
MLTRPRPWSADERTGTQPAGKSSKAERVVDLALPASALRRPLTVLSGGQQRAVALAAAAMVPKKAMLALDEPFVGLAPRVRDAAIDLIRDEGARRSVVLAEHMLELLPRVADTVFVLNRGALVSVQAVRDVVMSRLVDLFG